MKQNMMYLLKGLLFSALLFAILIFLLAFIMQQTQWGDSVMSPLTIVAFCMSGFLGGYYFAKHAPKRRFVWGLFFGVVFFFLYLAFLLCMTTSTELDVRKISTFLAAALGSGCAGGMLS